MFAWLVPIARVEAASIKDQGWDQFESVLEREDPDLPVTILKQGREAPLRWKMVAREAEPQFARKRVSDHYVLPDARRTRESVQLHFQQGST